MRYKLGLIISVIILLLVVFNFPIKEEQELKTDTLIAYIDGRRTDTIPTKSNDIKVDRIVCDNNADAEWDNANWGIYISDITNNSTKCSVYFKTFPAPELYTGLIPVTYDNNGNTVVADTSTEWYNYDNHIWANAVLGTSSARSKTAGQILSDSEILQYYVWIPRYRYQLFNTVSGQSADEQMINIEFENKNKPKSNGTTNGQWLTHPAFTFGNTELNGFWVGKFEPSHSDSQYINSSTANKLGCTNEQCSVSNGLLILPNRISIANNILSSEFYLSRSIASSTTFGLNSSEVDTRLIKNTEWAAITYLSDSKYGLYETANTCHNSDNNISVTINSSSVNRCKIWNNNVYSGTGCDSNVTIEKCGGSVTGCSSQTRGQAGVPGSTSCTSINGVDYSWNSSTNNGRSSTTGNIYGIYDMAGGNIENVMASQSSTLNSFVFSPANTGFVNPPDSKYYDHYAASANNETESTERMDIARGYLGDATREIYKRTSKGWFDDNLAFSSTAYPWIIRGSFASFSTYGNHYCAASSGLADVRRTFRVVLSEIDD